MTLREERPAPLSVRGAVKRLLRRRSASAPPKPPVLSVVVPVHDSVAQLPGCLESLAAQTVGRMEIVIVDDGSVDGSAAVAERFAEQHGNVRLVRQEHLGTGAARNAGVRQASGTFLAFCDSDDEVPPGAYDRLVDALTSSGSDIAVGSVALQEKGLFREPGWARRSNSDRRLGVGLAEVPDTVANLLPGTRVFRRSFWDEAHLCFSEGDDHGDAVTMVRALLVARRLDVVPAVVYRWRRREDGRSLLQRDLREPDRARTRLAELVDAVDLMLEQGAEPVQEQFLSDVLHTKARDLIRAAVCQGDSYWSAVQGEMRRLMRRVPQSTLERVPVEDRIVAWLCANDERSATEEFLEYAFDNKNGFPFREVDARSHIALPFVDTLATVDGAMTRVADSDMRYRSRLTHLAWTSPGVLTVEGGAFIEYVDDTEPGVVTLVLRERSTGETVTVPTVQLHQPTVNRWAARANEDHANAAFRAEIDVASLPRTEGRRATYDISVRLDLRGHSREAAFDSRRRGGSPGLLEKSDHDGLSARPVWHAIRGLGIQLRDASEKPAEAAEAPAVPSPVTVVDVTASGDVLELEGDATAAFEICLVGPRSRTPWVGAQRDGSAFGARISTLVDEWGLGSTSLPTDDYEVVARLADGSETPVHVAPALWRNLPVHVDSGAHLFLPAVSEAGALRFRITAGESRDTMGAFGRRRLRDEYYPETRERPLLDVALFDTFGGKAAGDNPGPLCEELARRDTGLDLVFAVVDRSVAVPAGARAVVRGSPEWFELLGRARYFVTNAPLPPFFRKRRGQVFLHTWHGSPLKRIAHDRKDQNFPNWHHRRQLLVSQRSWDFLVSQSPFCTQALRGAFLYDGEVLELGYPRNDILCSADAETVRRRTRKQLGLPEDARVVLYAPTWRDNQRTGAAWDKVIHLDTEEVVARVPGTYVLVRGHYNSMKAADASGADPRILDVTRYPDISHLYLAADALVTDYSSVFFDFVLTDKPMYFLAPDLEHYRDESRGFYLDYHATVPGPVCVTTEEVIDGLNGPDEYGAVREGFRAEYAPLDDGHASERIIDAMLVSGAVSRTT